MGLLPGAPGWCAPASAPWLRRPPLGPPEAGARRSLGAMRRAGSRGRCRTGHGARGRRGLGEGAGLRQGSPRAASPGCRAEGARRSDLRGHRLARNPHPSSGARLWAPRAPAAPPRAPTCAPPPARAPWAPGTRPRASGARSCGPGAGLGVGAGGHGLAEKCKARRRRARPRPPGLRHLEIESQRFPAWTPRCPADITPTAGSGSASVFPGCSPTSAAAASRPARGLRPRPQGLSPPGSRVPRSLPQHPPHPPPLDLEAPRVHPGFIPLPLRSRPRASWRRWTHCRGGCLAPRTGCDTGVKGDLSLGLQTLGHPPRYPGTRPWDPGLLTMTLA